MSFKNLNSLCRMKGKIIEKVTIASFHFANPE